MLRQELTRKEAEVTSKEVDLAETTRREADLNEAQRHFRRKVGVECFLM